MKVVFLNYNIYGVGGTVRTTVNLANEFARRGMDVSVISIRRTSDSSTFQIDQDVHVDPLVDVRAGSKLRGIRGFARKAIARIPSVAMHPRDDLYAGYSVQSDALVVARLRALRDCVLITTTPSFNLLALRLVHSSVLVVAQEHKVFDSHPESLRGSIVKHYGELEALHCITEEGAVAYRSLLGKSRVDVRYIPNGTVFEKSEELVETRCRREVVVAAGHLVENKGMDRVMRAFAQALTDFPTWRLEVYGVGPEQAALARLILELRLHNSVFLCGQTTDLSGVLSRSAIFALGSQFESFGMVLIEAMSEEVPCVAFESDGPRALIRDGGNGFLVPQGDLNGFGDALRRLMADPSERQAMGVVARASVSRYDIRTVGSEWTGWLDSLWDRHRRSARSRR